MWAYLFIRFRDLNRKPGANTWSANPQDVDLGLEEGAQRVGLRPATGAKSRPNEGLKGCAAASAWQRPGPGKPDPAKRGRCRNPFGNKKLNIFNTEPADFF